MKIPKIIFASLLVIGPLLVIVDVKDLPKFTTLTKSTEVAVAAAPAKQPAQIDKKAELPMYETATTYPAEKRDWVDITDKVVDWAVKIIGAIATLIGALGFKRKQEAKEVT